ncbi:MAG: formate dehydrogenase subunit gamma [Reyranellaceae bacterium]
MADGRASGSGLGSRFLPSFCAALLLALVFALSPSASQAQSSLRLDPDQQAGQGPVDGTVPGNTLGDTSDADYWRAVRGGVRGTVSIPDKKAGVLVQSEGDSWRAVRNGPLSNWGVWAMAGMLIALALFFLIRGRIRIERGWSGVTITRFNVVERMGHWLIASSFVVLALSGLNVLYGRYFLPAVIGKDAFAAITWWGKHIHNYVAFAFMLGLAWVFIAWVLQNIPNRHDLVWLAKGGGMFSKGAHVPARKFNAGQKIVFWLTVLGGLSVSLSGWALLFPFSTSMFSDTFHLVNAVFGTSLPEALSPVQEQQLAQVWHAAMSLFLIVVIFAHIYIGTIGMEGAFDAMGTGQVDLNWAREHHDLWVREELEKHPDAQHAPNPAE